MPEQLRKFAAFVLIVSFAIVTGDVFARSKTENFVFSNPSPIAINTTSGLTVPTKAAVYPSTIEVSGMTGNISRIAVTLSGLSHTNLSNLDFLLVGPTGAKYIFFSDGNSGFPNYAAEDNVFAFSDDAPFVFPLAGSAPSGNYRPSSGDQVADAFPAPAPAGPYNQPNAASFASTFNGSNPNGTWSLYVADDAIGNAGSISTGWAVSITTDGAPQSFSNSTYLGITDVFATAAPYGSAISVAGLSGVIANVRVTLNGLSHTAPLDIDALLVTPNGTGLVLMSDAGPGTSASNTTLTFDDAAASTVNPAVSGTYRPTDIQFDNDAFFSPAPLRPYHQQSANQLANLNGQSPNGDWRLFIVDDQVGNSGSIAGGWTLEVTTAPAPPPMPSSCAAPSFAASSFAAGISPTNVAIADLNNDGNKDLAVANQISNDVSILLGNGNGSFATQTLVVAGSSPYTIVAGKFNADSNWDLAVANSGSNNLSVLLGNGNGTFGPPVNFFVGSSPISVNAGDFNNDSKTDLAVANFGGFFSGTISILIGNGNGGFTNGTNLRTRSQPSYVAVGRMNSDANDDLVVANFGSNSLSIYLGNGSGTFGLLQNVSVPSPVWIELAQLDGDGVIDMAIASYNADALVRCFGAANGTVGSCTSSAIGLNPISVAAGDFVGNGTQVLATALSGQDAVRFAAADFLVGASPNALETGDFNNDGKPDLITVNSGSNNVSVLMNVCNGARGHIFDYNGDRRTDYAIFRSSVSGYFVQSLDGGGVFKYFGRTTDKLAPADFDGDRRTDLAYYRPESGLWSVIDRSSRPIYFTQFGIAEDLPVPADYDGDGRADVAVWRPSNGGWYVRRSTDNSVEISQFGSSGDVPVAADFDGDEKADRAVYRPSTGVWYIWRTTDGGFTITQFGLPGDKTVSGDYDGDGKTDIAVWRPSSGAWYVLRSSDGGFLAVTFGLPTDIPLVGEFDGDGIFDLAVFRPSDGFWYINRSSDGGVTIYPWGMSGDVPLPSAHVR